MKKIWVVYQDDCESRQALRAYSTEDKANAGKLACEQYEKTNNYPDFEDVDDDELEAYFAEKLEWIAGHPLNADCADLGYSVGGLELDT